jgi:hypothetical protein
VQELTDLLCSAFHREEFIRVVVYPLRGRVDDLRPDLTMPDAVFQLLLATERRGSTCDLLRLVARARNRRADLMDALRRCSPTVVPDAADPQTQVTRVVAGIEVITPDRLRDPAVRSALAESAEAREAIREAARQVTHLGPYKELHDILHQVQFRLFSRIEDAARNLGSGRASAGAADELADYTAELRDLAGRAADAAARLPDATGERRREQVWVGDLEQVVKELTPGPTGPDENETWRGVYELRKLLTFHPARLNDQLAQIAERLPVSALLTALDRIATTDQSGDAAVARSACTGLEGLRPQFDSLVAVHKDWQQLEPTLWDFEKQLKTPTGQQWPREVRGQWDGIKEDVDRLARIDPADGWFARVKIVSDTTNEKLLAPISPDEPLGSWYAFRMYRRRLIERFVAVDKELKSVCAEVVKLGDPLQRLGRRLPDAS